MPACLFPATLGPQELAGLVADTTFFGKTILLVLLVLSVMSWAVFIDKARTLARVRAGHQEFWAQCEQWLDGRCDRAELSAWCAGRPELPLCVLLREAGGLTQAPAIRRAAERVTYPDQSAVLRGLTMRIDSGERVGVMGPNGAGKTTLFLLLSGILHPT
ncbi:MAG: ATP-binding cassette domain-containing protein, partial [Candidatus Krumholzibacteriia bacterium]